ncbi:SDR family oxidoreductase [Umezawaea beigongshangensis]|uniref:SDR family oxidoreductase n=1 Tax=Umezawaea beigongshangensis TaxID=2780383 RepID=UPI0018F25C89|nr:SDR family oxidoreductase [Umezawaea beigongshangensis]
MKIENSIALVTGANRGIGAAFVELLLQRGAAKVYAASRRGVAPGVPGAVPLVLDVTDPASVAAAAEQARDVTLLVNNAGIANAQNLVDGDVAKMRAEIDVNVFGTLDVTRAFAPGLGRVGGGGIINVLSAASWFTFPGSGSYAVSKAAQWSLTTGVRMELAGQGTQVLGAHVGMVDTDMSAAIDVEKSSPAEFVSAVLDALENGEIEVTTDDMSRRAKASVAEKPGVFVP